MKAGVRRMTANEDLNEDLIGVAVFEPDGVEIGRVKDARDGYVQVDATLARDFWVRAGDLLQEGEDRLVVSGGAERLKRPDDGA